MLISPIIVSLRKIFLVFCISLLLFFSCYIAPKAHANPAAFAVAGAFLPEVAGITVATGGLALLGIAVIGAGVYVGTHTTDIKQIGGKLSTQLSNFWSGLTAVQKSAWDSVASGWDKTVSKSVSLTAEMQTMLRDYWNMKVVQTPVALSTTFPHSNTLTSLTTCTDAHVNSYFAIKFTMSGLTYALVPTNFYFDSSNMFATYRWYSSNGNGTWTYTSSATASGVYPETLQGRGIAGGTAVDSTLNYGGHEWQPYYNAGMATMEGSVPYWMGKILANMKVNNYDVVSTLVVAPWVDATQIGVKVPTDITIPAGMAVVGTGTQVKINAMDEAMALTLNPTIASDVPVATTPDYTPPTTANLDFSPLLMLTDAMTTKFPFSIPWDLKKQIAVFDITPETPDFHIEIPNFLVIAGFTIPLNFRLNFAQFDSVATVTRWFLIIVFDIAIILGIRRLMPS